MSASHRKTGFFGLPLELRQKFYNELVPQDRLLTFEGTHWRPSRSEAAMYDACRADRKIRNELWPWCRKYCGIRLVIGSLVAILDVPGEKALYYD